MSSDVLSLHVNGIDNQIASTSRLALGRKDDNDNEQTLAQLLEETVRTSSRGSNNVIKDGAVSSPSLPSLPALNSPASRTYISSLLSKDLVALLREPDELAKQAEVLDAELSSLCYRSTGDLLGVGQCLDSVEDGFGSVSSA